MQIVTPFCSAWPTTCFRATTQFSRPSLSGMPSRLPEKVITLGKPASAVASMAAVIASRQASWLAGSLMPFVMPWLFVMAQERPCSCRVGKASGPRISMDSRPIARAAAASSSSGMRP